MQINNRGKASIRLLHLFFFKEKASILSVSFHSKKPCRITKLLFCGSILLLGLQYSFKGHAQAPTLNADSVYSFMRQQFGFLANAPDSLPPYLQREVLSNVLRNGTSPETIFFDRVGQLNTAMIDSLLSGREIRNMKGLATQQTMNYWKADSLQITGLEIIDKKKLPFLLGKNKRRISLALSPPYFSSDYQYAFLMIERRSASEGWDALLLWQRQTQGWKVIDAKMWFWHPVIIRR